MDIVIPAFSLDFLKNKLFFRTHWHAVSQVILCTVFTLTVTACASDPNFDALFPKTGIASETMTRPMSASQPITAEDNSSTTNKERKNAGESADAATHVVTPRSAESAVPAPPVTREGSAAYHIPKLMVEGRASLVDLWIDRSTTLGQLKQELAQKLQITADKIKIKNVRDTGESRHTVLAQIDAVTIPIGDTMIAQLRGGDDFSIDPKEPVTQSLKNENRAKWNWRVTPKHKSDAGMYLDLDIWIDPGSGKRLIDSYHESVVVKARQKTWYEMAQDLDKWLVLLGFGGISGLFSVLFKRYRKKKTA